MQAYDEKCGICVHNAGRFEEAYCKHPKAQVSASRVDKPGARMMNEPQELVRAPGSMCGPSAALWEPKQAKEA